MEAISHNQAQGVEAVAQKKTRPSHPDNRGRGRIFQRGSRYWIAYYAPREGRSVEHREPGGGTEKEARRKLKDRLDEILARKRLGLRFQGPRQERITVEELLASVEQDYVIHGRKSLPQLRSHLRHIRNFFAMDRVPAVTAERLRHYIAGRQQEGAEAATINRELEGLRRAFSLAIENQTLATMPVFPNLAEDNARQGFFERADFEAVLFHLRDADLRDFCEWFYRTGMRPGEIRSLTWEALDRETWALRLHAKDAKTRRGRIIALAGEVRAIIERRLRARRLDCVLIFHRNGKPVGDFRKVWTRACRLAGVDGKLVYDLRRTAVRNMVRAGVDPAVAMKISGHRTRNVFDRYNIISEDDIRQAVLKTDAYVEALPRTSPLVTLQSAAIG
jgi:integrase